jgi:hypothetical protein
MRPPLGFFEVLLCWRINNISRASQGAFNFLKNLFWTRVDLYNELKSVGDEKKRALLALRLGNAFAVDPDKIEYKARLQKFLDATKKNRRKVEARFISEFNANHAYLNVLDVLRDDRVRYNTFLEMLAESSLEVYEAIIRYPNAAGFLLEHGMDSIEYINKTAGEIVVLSMLLPVEGQDAMMALFKRYEWMTDVLNECGAESYFAVSAVQNKAKSKIAP